LGDGTEESNRRLQDAIDHLYRFTQELTTPTQTEKQMANLGIGPDIEAMQEKYYNDLHAVMEEAKVSVPANVVFQFGGKEGRHTEQMGYILADFQFMQRAYPDMKW